MTLIYNEDVSYKRKNTQPTRIGFSLVCTFLYRLQNFKYTCVAGVVETRFWDLSCRSLLKGGTYKERVKDFLVVGSLLYRGRMSSIGDP